MESPDSKQKTESGGLDDDLRKAAAQLDVKAVFDGIERIRKTVKLPEGFRIKDLIEEGRL